MAVKKSKRRLKNQELSIKNLILRELLFTLLFCLIGFIVSLTLSYFLFKTKDPTSLITVSGLCSLYISVFLSGYISSKVNGQKYFLGGLMQGIFIFMLTYILCLLMPEYKFNVNNLIWRLMIPLFCILGAMIGTRRKRKRKKH